MSGEIWDAIERLNERKNALGMGANGGDAGDDGQRLVMSGLDLDLEELDQARTRAVQAAVEMASQGGGDRQFVVDLIAGLWVDGVMTGVLIEQARR